MTTPAASVQLHIRRLVVDAEAIPPGGVPHDLALHLQVALAARLLNAGAATGAPATNWIDNVADALATRVREHAPEAAP